MLVNVKFTEDELEFVKEALFEKYENLMAKIEDAEGESGLSFRNYLQEAKSHFEKPIEEPKKVHWTQTPEGKKKMAARKKAKK